MPKFEVQIARSFSEYASVEVEATDESEAQAQVETILTGKDDTAYCNLVNNVDWGKGGEAHDERVLDVTEIEEKTE